MIRLTPHGGNVYSAARQLGRPLHRLIDFSASINPLGPSPRAMIAIRAAMPRLVHYPDPECLALRQALATWFKLPVDHFVIGNGSSELIHLLPAALAIRRAAVVGPTFSEYAHAVMMAGGRITRIDADRAEHYHLPLARVLASIQSNRPRIDAVFLCNPNSPTGQAAPPSQLHQVIHAAERRGIWMVVDETFVEYCHEYSVLSDVTRLSQLLILRSFTKFYGLPGLRIGYVAGSKLIIERIQRRQPPWSVNMLAQTAAVAALKDRVHARRSLAFMNQERRRLAERLGSLPGVVVFPSTANFLMLTLPARMPASRLVAALHREGLLVRDCSSVPGLSKRTVRIAVRTTKDNDRLLIGLSRMLKRSE